MDLNRIENHSKKLSLLFKNSEQNIKINYIIEDIIFWLWSFITINFMQRDLMINRGCLTFENICNELEILMIQ